MLINLATTNIDYSNPQKAMRQIQNNVMQLKDTVEMAMNNLDAGNIVLDNGSSLQVAVNSEELRGPQGFPGQNGFSPIVNISKTSGVTTISIQDENGLHTSTVSDGTNGIDGQDGVDGQDGFSPTIVVKTDTSDEYVLTITTKTGSFDTPNLRG